ncbi:MAG: HigA family addiction module antitoxin [Thermodesulfobacteriota bacterium]
MIKTRSTACQPNYAIPPGETLRETLETIGMKQAELAERTGRPKKTINEIIAGKAAITAETALQLERVLGVPASFWNNLERNYRESLARLKEEEKLQKQIEWLRKFPLTILENMDWVPREDNPIKKLKALLSFFAVAGIEEWNRVWGAPQGVYRKSKAFQSHPEAIATWLRKGEIEAAQISTQPYHSRSFHAALRQIRSLTDKPPEVFEPKMKEVCAQAGVAVVFVPEIHGTHVYGVTRWLKSTKALIQMSLRGKTDDHLWFTFFHEAGHILLHGKDQIFIETSENGYKELGRKEKEDDADRFSQDFLIPPQEFQSFLDNCDFSLSAIRRFAKEIGIAPGIVVGRLQHDSLISFNRGNALKKRLQFS